MAATHTNVFYTAPVRKAGFITTFIAAVKDWNDERQTRMQLEQIVRIANWQISACAADDIDTVVEKHIANICSQSLPSNMRAA